MKELWSSAIYSTACDEGSLNTLFSIGALICGSSAQCSRAAEPRSVARGLGGVVPAPGAAGAVGPGRRGGHRDIRAGDSVSGGLRPAVRMLLRPRETDEEEEE